MALASLGAARAHAQVVRGHILEAETRKPVAGARVTLVRTDDTSGVVAVSAQDGEFTVRARRAGMFRVEVARLGYRPQTEGPFALAREQVLELEVALPVVPYTMDPVTVTAEVNTRFLQNVGFYDRQRADFGRFITRDQIESRRASRPTDLLVAIPGVAIVPDPHSPGRVRLQMRGTHPAQGGACAPRVYVDGLILIRGDAHPMRPGGTARDDELERALDGDPRNPEPSLDDVVNPDQIEAIEVYRSASQVPAEFGGASVYTRCGVVVIWTRHGR
jgi:hypothetical protein